MAVVSAARWSPNGGSPNNLDFYSAPSSPAIGDELSPRFDNDYDFEFETSKKFSNSMEFDDGNFECFLEVEPKPKIIRPRRGCGVGSLPTTMSFADELFFNGLVMPLKPPPRLQVQVHQGGVSVPSSPTSGFKNPFVRRVAWNDDFDPFIVALQKVSEENRGRSSSAVGSHHRRTRSHSPFRTNHSETEHHHHHRCNNNNNNNTNNGSGRSSHFNNMPQEQLKSSPYARWVLDQTSNHHHQLVNPPPKGKNLLKGFTFVKSRVRPVKTTDIFGEKKGHQENGIGETKMKRIKGFLQKYASFRKENGEDKSTNQNSTRPGASSYSYLKKLSFKMKGNSAAATDENRKKRLAIMEMEEPKMAVVEYKRNKPTLALCFYGIESPRKQIHQ